MPGQKKTRKKKQIKIAQQVLWMCATPLGELAQDDSVKFTARFPFVMQAFIYFILENVPFFCYFFLTEYITK